MHVDEKILPSDLSASLNRLFELAGQKVRLIEKTWDP